MSAPDQDVRTSARARERAATAPRRPRSGQGSRRTAFLAATAGVVLVSAAVYVVLTRPGSLSNDRPLEGYSPEAATYLVLPASVQDPADDAGWLRDGLPEIVASELTTNPDLKVVSRSTVLAALQARGLADAAKVPRQAGLAIARELRVERLVTSELRRVDDRFTFRVEVLDAGSGQLVHEAVEEGRRRDDLIDAATAVGNRLVRELPHSPSYVLGEALSSPPPTRSEEAYRAYVEARLAEARGGRDGLSVAGERLRAAVQADPAFARACVRLALVLHRQRRLGMTDADPRPSITMARALNANLAERERELMRGLWALWVENQPAVAVEHWTTVLVGFPSFAQDAGVPVMLAEAQARLGRWEDLIQATLSTVEAPALSEIDRAHLCSLLALAFHHHGEYGRAVSYGTRAVDSWPVREGPAFLRLKASVGRILVDGGNRDRAVEMFRTIAAAAQPDVASVTDAAWGLYMAGDRGEAARVLEQALQLDGGYGPAYHLRAWLRLTAGEFDGAASDFREAYERTVATDGDITNGGPRGDVVALYYEGVAHQKAGRAAEASAAWRTVVSDSRQVLASTTNPVARWQAGVLAALAAVRMGASASLPGRLEQDEARSLLAETRLHALLGRRADAIEDIRNAISLGLGDLQRVLDDPDCDALRSTPEFVRLLQRSGPGPD